MSNADFAPGVRIVEAPPVAQPINPGPTLTGIIGRARRGRVDAAQIVTSWDDYVRLYGGYSSDIDLGVYAQDYFACGGASLRALRLAAADAVASSNTSDALNRDGDVAMEIHAISPGLHGDDVSVDFVMASTVSTAGQVTTDSNGNDLPDGTVAIPVANVNAFVVGDVVDVFLPDGSFSATTFVYGVEASSNSVIVDSTDLDVNAGGWLLRTASQHRVKTRAMADLANGATSLELSSAQSLSRGSLLEASIYSHCATASDRSLALRVPLIVDRISGSTVFFTAAASTPGAVTLPVAQSAALRYVVDIGIYIDFIAVPQGPAGNSISIRFVTGAASNSVAVTGKTVVISTDGTFTLAQIAAAIAALAPAAALVSTAITGLDTSTPSENLAATRLTGGAQLLVTSLEFGMNVLFGQTVVEQHKFLSMIPTNPDYIATRIGGNPDTYTPVSGSQTSYIIVSGVDAAVDSASGEYLAQPRALTGIGLSGGSDGSDLTDDEWIGSANPVSGLHLLASYEDIKLLIAPGVTSPAVQLAMLDLCEQSGRVVALLDPPVDARSASALLLHRTNDLGADTRFGQLASTWAKVVDRRSGAIRGALITVPPSPGFAALIAQGQAEQGPHGSPGGRSPTTWVEILYNAGMDDAGLLDNNNVSVFRVVSGSIKCFGDNSLLQVQGDPRQFGSVSRMINQLIHDLESDLSGVIFQPGNELLYSRISALLNKRLDVYFKAGALYPQSNPKLAYRATCDNSTTSLEDIAAGRFYAEVEISPSTLAKQIVLRLSVSAGGVKISSNN